MKERKELPFFSLMCIYTLHRFLHCDKGNIFVFKHNKSGLKKIFIELIINALKKREQGVPVLSNFTMVFTPNAYAQYSAKVNSLTMN